MAVRGLDRDGVERARVHADASAAVPENHDVRRYDHGRPESLQAHRIVLRVRGAGKGPRAHDGRQVRRGRRLPVAPGRGPCRCRLRHDLAFRGRLKNVALTRVIEYYRQKC